jgi:hypothetical protein
VGSDVLLEFSIHACRVRTLKGVYVPVTPMTAMIAHGAPALTGSVATTDADFSSDIAFRFGESANAGDVLFCVDILNLKNPKSLQFGSKTTEDLEMGMFKEIGDANLITAPDTAPRLPSRLDLDRDWRSFQCNLSCKLGPTPQKQAKWHNPDAMRRSLSCGSIAGTSQDARRKTQMIDTGVVCTIIHHWT